MRDFIIGDGEGQIPLDKLRVTLMRLPRRSAGKDVNALDKRLKALAARPPMPKGAIPKNMRPPKGAMRGDARPLAFRYRRRDAFRPVTVRGCR